MVGFGFDLLHRRATVTFELHDIDSVWHHEGDIDSAFVGGIFGYEFKPEGFDIGIKDAHIVTLILIHFVASKEIVGDRCIESSEMCLKCLDIVGIEGMVDVALVFGTLVGLTHKIHYRTKQSDFDLLVGNSEPIEWCIVKVGLHLVNSKIACLPHERLYLDIVYIKAIKHDIVFDDIFEIGQEVVVFCDEA